MHLCIPTLYANKTTLSKDYFAKKCVTAFEFFSASPVQRDVDIVAGCAECDCTEGLIDVRVDRTSIVVRRYGVWPIGFSPN